MARRAAELPSFLVKKIYVISEDFKIPSPYLRITQQHGDTCCKYEGIPLLFVQDTFYENIVLRTLCNALDYLGTWILKKNFPTHRKAAVHVRSEALQTAARNVEGPVPAEEEFVMFNDVTIPAVPKPRTDSLHGHGEEQAMWDVFDHGGVMFDAGEDPTLLSQQRNRELEHKADHWGVWAGAETLADSVDLNDTWAESDEEDLLAEIMRGIDLETDEAESDQCATEQADNTPWFPYNSKLLFLLDTIDNFPRLRISESLMRVLLWLLRELGVSNVPSFDLLRKTQKKLREDSGVPTVHWMSPKGNAYSFNDVGAIIANDWSNPLVRPHIKRYPVIPPGGVISEVWHAEKWREIDRHFMSPMYDDGIRHYFIDELAQLKNGEFVIPLRWLEDADGRIVADAWHVQLGEDARATVIDSVTVMIHTDDLVGNYLNLVEENLVPEWSVVTAEAGHPLRMPNPDRALAEGDPIYTSFIDVFGDDVSGNRSKSWNKHWNIYVSHRNLTRKLLHQQFHTHFVSTSTHASIPEQFHGVKSIIESTHIKPVKVRDADTGKQIRLKIYCNCGPGDNPAQSETSGHIGVKGNYPCRKCHGGGTQKFKETSEGFHKMFLRQSGEPRSSVETLEEVRSQVKTACLGVAQTVKDSQTETGIKDTYTQYWIDALIESARATQKKNPTIPTAMIQAGLMKWVHDKEDTIYNSFLTLDGFDASRDTPVEILHTILLGVVKYLWHGSHTSWTATQKKIYSVRLQGTNAQALSIHNIRANYIMQYANSLIGRQLKTLAQVNVFHVYDLVDPVRFLLTKAVGELSSLLWYPEIRNREEYLSDIDVAVANVLDIAALLDPSKIVSKVKYHLLSHIREDITRFGPLVGVATEVFESFNAIFRYCSILSNHLAPSRDIAYKMSALETMKHFLSGGWWNSEAAGKQWVEPGPSIRWYMASNPVLQTLCGWSSNEVLTPGTVKLEPQKRGPNRRTLPLVRLRWSETAASRAINNTSPNNDAQWGRCKYIIAKSQDRCTVGSWVFARSPLSEGNTPAPGRIVEILENTTRTSALVVIDVFRVASTRDEVFGMPVLSRAFNERAYFSHLTLNMTAAMQSVTRPENDQLRRNASPQCQSSPAPLKLLDPSIHCPSTAPPCDFRGLCAPATSALSTFHQLSINSIDAGASCVRNSVRNSPFTSVVSAVLICRALSLFESVWKHDGLVAGGLMASLCSTPSVHVAESGYENSPGPASVSVFHNCWQLVGVPSQYLGVLRMRSHHRFHASRLVCTAERHHIFIGLPLDVNYRMPPPFEVLIGTCKPHPIVEFAEYPEQQSLFYPSGLPLNSTSDLANQPHHRRSPPFSLLKSTTRYLTTVGDKSKVVDADACLAPQPRLLRKDGRAATISVTLPSRFEGGALIIHDIEGDLEKYPVQGGKMRDVEWTAYLPDFEYEVEPIMMGCRISVDYGVFPRTFGPCGPERLRVFESGTLLYHAIKLYKRAPELHSTAGGYIWPTDRTVDFCTLKHQLPGCMPLGIINGNGLSMPLVSVLSVRGPFNSAPYGSTNAEKEVAISGCESGGQPGDSAGGGGYHHLHGCEWAGAGPSGGEGEGLLRVAGEA
ncbi:hypothetical protein FPV67DRAFT_1653670 [Lyophyllum atratum]|nr:hypothetical protein FPV67DRAFT_1653670 [Lyophyllum atratum]